MTQRTKLISGVFKQVISSLSSLLLVLSDIFPFLLQICQVGPKALKSRIVISCQSEIVSRSHPPVILILFLRIQKVIPQIIVTVIRFC